MSIRYPNSNGKEFGLTPKMLMPMMVTMADKKDPSARARTVNHTAVDYPRVRIAGTSKTGGGSLHAR